MDISEYIEERLEKQKDWYQGKASYNKKRFMNFQTTIIILGALIPLIVVFVGSSVLTVGAIEISSGHISAVIAAIIAILAGIDKLTQPQTNWFNYRANEEMLKKEKWMFEFNSGPYNGLKGAVAEKLLVDRVESIISSDIARFASAEYKDDGNNNHNGGATPPTTG